MSEPKTTPEKTCKGERGMGRLRALDRVRTVPRLGSCEECGEMGDRLGRVDPYPGYPEGRQPPHVRAVRLLGCMRLHILQSKSLRVVEAGRGEQDALEDYGREER